MKKRIRMFLPLVVLAAMLAAVLPMAVPVAAALDGVVNIGPGVLIIPDPSGDVGLPLNAPNGTVSGWDMTALHLAYNQTSDIMYVGIHTNGIIGDVDGNGDPATASAWLTTNGGSDLADLGSSETIAVYFDLDRDGTYDVIAGISGTTDYDGFSVNTFTGAFFPPYNFGAALPDNIGEKSPNPSATYPDFEFTVTNWTALPGHDGDPGFCVGVFLGSLQDDGVGEDSLLYCESPCIAIEKLVDCNDDGVYLDEDTGLYGDTPSWFIEVTNCGDCDLYDVYVSDDYGPGWGPFDLPIGVSWNVTYDHPGPIYGNTTNNATAIAEEEAGLPVGPVYDAATNVVIQPDICIEKLVDCNDDGVYLDEDTGLYGDTPSWFIEVTNCGDSPLHDIYVSDDYGPGWGPFDLDVGESWNVTYDHPTAIFADTTNNATAEGLSVLDGLVGPVYDAATNVVIQPDICIEKLVDCNDDQEYLHEDTGSLGDTPSWFIRVWNCGDSPLHGVNVTDTNGMSWGPFDLDVGESWNVTYTGTAIYETTTNNATAVGLDVLGGVVGPVFDSATNVITGGEGCTPGFWKNNADKKGAVAWGPTGYSPSEKFSDVFGVVITVRAGGRRTITDPTLLQALGATGGGVNALARHGVAALLNSAHPGIAYGIGSPAGVIALVHDALVSPDPGAIGAAHIILADYNEAGCPINQQGEPEIPDVEVMTVDRRPH